MNKSKKCETPVGSDALFGFWNTSDSAPRGDVILGFFEDIGWKTCAWDDVHKVWRVGYCKTAVSDDDEYTFPMWIDRAVFASDLRWWMPMPHHLHPSHSDF